MLLTRLENIRPRPQIIRPRAIRPQVLRPRPEVIRTRPRPQLIRPWPRLLVMKAMTEPIWTTQPRQTKARLALLTVHTCFI